MNLVKKVFQLKGIQIITIIFLAVIIYHNILTAAPTQYTNEYFIPANVNEWRIDSPVLEKMRTVKIEFESSNPVILHSRISTTDNRIIDNISRQLESGKSVITINSNEYGRFNMAISTSLDTNLSVTITSWGLNEFEFWATIVIFVLLVVLIVILSLKHLLEIKRLKRINPGILKIVKSKDSPSLFAYLKTLYVVETSRYLAVPVILLFFYLSTEYTLTQRILLDRKYIIIGKYPDGSNIRAYTYDLTVIKITQQITRFLLPMMGLLIPPLYYHYYFTDRKLTILNGSFNKTGNFKGMLIRIFTFTILLLLLLTILYIIGGLVGYYRWARNTDVDPWPILHSFLNVALIIISVISFYHLIGNLFRSPIVQLMVFPILLLFSDLWFSMMNVELKVYLESEFIGTPLNSWGLTREWIYLIIYLLIFCYLSTSKTFHKIQARLNESMNSLIKYLKFQIKSKMAWESI